MFDEWKYILRLYQIYLFVFRINVGGLHVSHYLLRLLQLRYPALQSLLTLSRAEELVHNHCVIANDYIRALSEKCWPNITIQLPFNYGVGGGQVIDFAKQEEKDQQRRERARQHLLRLSQNKREEKVGRIICMCTDKELALNLYMTVTATAVKCYF